MSDNPIGSQRKQLYAAGKNKNPIVEVLSPRVRALRTVSEGEDVLRDVRLVEVASGTGEHASLFLEHMPYLHYQPTEFDESMHASIEDWLSEDIAAGRALPPVALDIENWPTAAARIAESPFGKLEGTVDVIVCINMIHISPLVCTEKLFDFAAYCLKPTGFLMTYGPYRVKGHMVDSNVAFDAHLKSRNPEWGVRDLEVVEAFAHKHGIRIKEVVEMPSNNLCVIFAKY